MPHTKDPDAPPPYAAYTTSTSSSSSHQTILNQLSTTRTRHIQSIIEQHILPIIHERTTFGIAQTTLALLPSDIPLPAATTAEDTGPSEFSFSDSDTKPVEVIGFSSEDSPIVVRLQGAMNKTEFWRPQVVIDELENLLSLNLNPSLDSTVGAAGAPAGSVLGGAEEGVQQRHHSRRNFLLSRVMPSLGPEQRSPGNNPEVGVRQAVDARGVVMVKARLEEICLRTVSEFGLFDTMSKQCVIIRVDARC